MTPHRSVCALVLWLVPIAAHGQTASEAAVDEPAVAVDPAAPAEPAVADPAEPAEPTEPAEPAPAEPAPAEPVEPAEPAEPVGPQVGVRIAIRVALDASTTPRQTELFKANLIAELSKLTGIEIVAAPSPAAEAECRADDASCLDRIAEGLGADEMVSARTTVLGDARVLNLKRVRIRDGEVLGAVTKQITGGSGEQALAHLGAAVHELYPDASLRAGASRGVPADLVAAWDPPPLPPWVFWTGAGLTVGAGAAAVITALLAKSAESDFNTLAAAGQNGPISGGELVELEDRANGRFDLANGLIITTASLAALTAVAWWLTDWGDATLIVAPADGGAAVGLTATF